MPEQQERPAADARRGAHRTAFERFTEVAQHWVSRPRFFVLCVAIVLIWLFSVPLWTDLKEWHTVIHTVTSVITLLLLALLENNARRSEEASHEKLNLIAEALAALMASRATQDSELTEAVSKLRDAVGLEERH
jgi:low affinity Fe/Cu permease